MVRVNRPPAGGSAAHTKIAAKAMAAAIRDALARGAMVEIDGLGSFRKNGDTYQFRSNPLARVFVAYAHEDAAKAGRIYAALEAAGFDPWMDERKLLPGQNWGRAIRNALETSDFVVCCFSHNSAQKRGGFQTELRYALDATRRLPLDEVFLLPVRLDNCVVPADVAREMQYVDLFPDWHLGMRHLFAAIRHQQRQHPRAA